MSSSRHDDDDDFSPEDAFNMFTPIYRPGAQDHLNVAAPPHVLGPGEDIDLVHGVTVDSYLPAGITLAGPSHGGGGPPPDLLESPVSRDVDPVGWIFGEREDMIIIPLVLSLIGIFAVVSNLIVLSALVGLRRMRSGPNVMLANLAVADLAIVTAAVPTGVMTRVVGMSAVSALACRSVHYVIFVGVYVAMYTLVVVCVFAFFGELLGARSASRRKAAGSETGRQGSMSMTEGRLPVPLSVRSAAVSCLVIWAAFGASHLTFVVQSDIAGLAAFEEPLICVYGASTNNEDLEGDSTGTSGGESAKARTLWVTFLACAFLLPLVIVCALSAAVMRLQRRRHDRAADGPLPVDESTPGCSREVEASQNLDNDGRGKRQLTMLVMASTVARTVCWLPLQIFVLADVFGPEPETETADADAGYRRKWELFCVCAALIGSCVTLPVLRAASTECRDSFRLVLRPCCGRPEVPKNHPPSVVAARRVQLDHGPPCSPSLTAAMLHRQRSYQPPEDDYDNGRPKHLSLPSSGRLSVPDVNETILSIISDSSNHINYAC